MPPTSRFMSSPEPERNCPPEAKPIWSRRPLGGSVVGGSVVGGRVVAGRGGVGDDRVVDGAAVEGSVVGGAVVGGGPSRRTALTTTDTSLAFAADDGYSGSRVRRPSVTVTSVVAVMVGLARVGRNR